MATTLFRDLNVIAVTGYLALALVIFAAAAGLALRWLNGCSSAASARTRFRCHNESASETTNQA